MLQGLRYTYYCADRMWSKKTGLRGGPSTDYLILTLLTVWMADLGFFFVCLNGGPGASIPTVASKSAFEAVGGGLAIVVAILWSLKRQRAVAAMYREFEPEGLPLPIRRDLVIRTVLVPVAIFVLLTAVLAIQKHLRQQHLG